MTDAQWKVKSNQISDDVQYELRKFRKECVTQGIVMFVRDVGFYEMTYRGHFVCYLYGDEDSRKLSAVWYTIQIAEETIKEIEGVKHDC
jgi:hypothetical protein